MEYHRYRHRRLTAENSRANKFPLSDPFYPLHNSLLFARKRIAKGGRGWDGFSKFGIRGIRNFALAMLMAENWRNTRSEVAVWSLWFGRMVRSSWNFRDELCVRSEMEVGQVLIGRLFRSVAVCETVKVKDLPIYYRAVALCTEGKHGSPAEPWCSWGCLSRSTAPCKSRRTSSLTNGILCSPLQNVRSIFRRAFRVYRFKYNASKKRNSVQ